ncbi:MAG: bacterial proteasome activator family protein [Acidimicrobiales bacterium]
MSDVPTGNPNAAEPVAPELVTPTTDGETDGEGQNNVAEPAKVMRVGTMIRQLLDEVRQTELDGPSRDRLREIYETSIAEIGGAVSPDLREELDRLALPFGEGTPTDAELRIAQAQLVGWLEGLFHGIQATLFAQQMAARNQLEDMRRQLPPGGQPGEPGDPPPGGGTYL